MIFILSLYFNIHFLQKKDKAIICRSAGIIPINILYIPLFGFQKGLANCPANLENG